jgi:hypothetical protein
MKQKQTQDAEIVRTTIRVPRSLWDAAKHRAIEERIPVQDLVIRALTSYVIKKGGRA